jgi:hypothetical protein
MGNILLIVALAVALNVGCILSWNRAQQALRDLGALWVRMLSGRRFSSSH